MRFSVIKKYEPERDGGYGFLHGVGLVWHKGKLYASFAHNKNPENTTGEEARWRVSEDGGQTWSAVFDMDKGTPEVAVSHGSFLSRIAASSGPSWARSRASESNVHTRAYVLDEKRNSWQPQWRDCAGRLLAHAGAAAHAQRKLDHRGLRCRQR